MIILDCTNNSRRRDVFFLKKDQVAALHIDHDSTKENSYILKIRPVCIYFGKEKERDKVFHFISNYIINNNNAILTIVIHNDVFLRYFEQEIES